MKINVGDYARFDFFRVNTPIQIAKIIKKHYDKEEKYYFYNTDAGLVITDENIIKSSPNIIDLIQEGDYINGKLVTTAEDVYTTDNIYIGKEVFVNHDELIIEEDIENIVTHEMFESIKYKVGE